MSQVASVLSAVRSCLAGWLQATSTPVLTAEELQAIRRYALGGGGKEAALAAYRAARGRGVAMRGAAMLLMREVEDPVPDVILLGHFRTALRDGGC